MHVHKRLSDQVGSGSIRDRPRQRTPARRQRRGWLLAFALTLGIATVTPASGAFLHSTGNSANAFDADTLDPPTALDTSMDDTDIVIDWSVTPDVWATGYEIWRSTTPTAGT